MALGIKLTVDFAFKKVFGSSENTAALIGLLNAILDLPQPIEHVEILNPFSYQEFAEDKQIVLDVRAHDAVGRWFNVEMQVAIHGGLLQRLVYYACDLYVAQLTAGRPYTELRPAISICLLGNVLFRDSGTAHHRFRLMDPVAECVVRDTIEIHTVELPKYNLREETLAAATPIERWVFFLLFADQYDAERLRELFPEAAFRCAVAAAETIASKTEDRVMYDQREKAQRDYLSAIAGAHQDGLQEGLEKGMERGMERGVLIGKIQLLQQLLGDEPVAATSLRERSPEELSAMLHGLQERLRARGQ